MCFAWDSCQRSRINLKCLLAPHLDHISHQAALAGAVKLLANPPTAGYTQNPIAVYYCYSEAGSLEVCIAVVQNTPWGARVTFAFKPEGESIPKALHVSPFMDMKNMW